MENTKDQCLLVCHLCHLLFHKAGPLCCFTCLNICFMKITHIIGIYVRYVLVWVSNPFLELLPRPVFSPLLSTPFPACCGCTPCLGSKEGEREAYFKTDLFYAFIMKANLFSNVQCLNGIGQQSEETGVAASRSGLHPAPLPQLLPSPPCPVHGGLVPRAQPRASPQGRTCSRKSWSKDLVTLSTLDDPLGFSGMNPVEESVLSVCTRAPHAVTSQRCAPGLPPSPAAGGRQLHGRLCHTRMSVCPLMDPGYGAKAKGNGLGSLVLQRRRV